MVLIYRIVETIPLLTETLQLEEVIIAFGMITGVANVVGTSCAQNTAVRHYNSLNSCTSGSANSAFGAFYTFGHLNCRIFGNLSVTKATLPRTFSIPEGVNVQRCK